MASGRLQALGSRATAVLLQSAQDSREHPGFRARAIETLAAIGSADLGALAALAAAAELQVRWTAIVELGKHGDQDSLPVVAEILATDAAVWTPQPGFTLRIRDAAKEAIESIRARQGTAAEGAGLAAEPLRRPK